MAEIDLAAQLHDYLKALEERDLDQCLDHYTEDAVIHFGPGVYQGKQAIIEWHKGRFEADLQITHLENISAQENQVLIEVVVTSNRLKAWRINTLRGKGTFRFEDGKIREARFSLAGANPFESWR